MKDDSNTLAIGIDYPSDGTEITENLQPGGNCAAEFSANGRAVKVGWKAVTVFTLLKEGEHNDITAREVVENGDQDAEIIYDQDQEYYLWTKRGLLTRCKDDGDCCGNTAAYTLAVVVHWIDDNDPMAKPVYEPSLDGKAERSRFRVRCSQSTDGKASSGDQRGVVWNDGEWSYHIVDLEGGSVIVGADLHGPVRARRIACFARDVAWNVHGLPWLSVRSPGGLLRVGAGGLSTSLVEPRERGMFLAAAFVQQNQRIVASPSFPTHPRLATMITATTPSAPTVIDLDPEIDARLQVNVLPNGRHTGTLIVAVKVLD